MKFTIERDALFEAVQNLQSVVEKKSTVQILSNILCVAKDSVLSLFATDLEVGIKVNLPAKIEEEGKITLSASHFLNIVRELPSKPVHITRKSNDWVEITSAKSRFNIVSLSADEYPSFPTFEDRTYSEARVDSLNEMIDKTSFAVSTDATRYHMNGVFFEPLENGVMRMTATDGHRLSFLDKEVFLKSPEIKRGMIIPRKGLSELCKLLDKAESTIQVSFDRGYFFAFNGQTQVFVRLIEGEYPDYRQVIPKSVDRLAQADRDTFLHALKRVSLLAHEKSRGIRLNFHPGMLVITSSNPDMGEAREELDIDYSGEAVEIGFNAKYLTDCLEVVSSKEVEFHFKDRLSPGIIRGKDQKNHTYVIMPMRF